MRDGCSFLFQKTRITPTLPTCLADTAVPCVSARPPGRRIRRRCLLSPSSRSTLAATCLAAAAELVARARPVAAELSACTTSDARAPLVGARCPLPPSLLSPCGSIGACGGIGVVAGSPFFSLIPLRRWTRRQLSYHLEQHRW